MSRRPGRSLDTLVHRRIMDAENLPIPHYSTSVAAAFMVVHRMQKRGLLVEIHRSETFTRCSVDGHPSVEDSTPHAICLASLRALGVSENEVVRLPASTPPESLGRRWLSSRRRHAAS